MAFRIITTGTPVSYDTMRIGNIEHWVAIVDLNNTNTFKILFTRPSSDNFGKSTLSFYSVGRATFNLLQLLVGATVGSNPAVA